MKDRNRAGTWLLAAAAGSVLAVAGCPVAIPSANLPRLEQRWGITALETTIGMDELINRNSASSNGAGARSSVAIGEATWSGSSHGGTSDSCSATSVDASFTSKNNVVVVNVAPTTLECSLRALCASCVAGSQPKPEFMLDTTKTFSLPDQADLAVESAMVTGGTVTVSLAHGLDFVPLKQSEVEIAVWSIGDAERNAEKLAAFSLEQELVGGTPVSYEHDFSQNPATIVGGVRLEITIDSPADPTTTVNVDLDNTIRVTTEVDALTVSAAGVRVDKEVAADPQSISLDEETTSEIVDRVKGDITITITFINPFPVKVQGTIDLGTAVRLTEEERSVTIKPGTSAKPVTTSKAVTITDEELQAFLKRGVYSFAGRVLSDGVVTLDTDAEILVRIAVDLSLVTESE